MLGSIKLSCPFKPDLYSSPVKLKSTETSPTRLYSKTTTHRIAKANQTSECSFKPKTGRAPRFKRNSDDLSIGAYLHSQKSKRDLTEGSSQQDKNLVFAGENSLKIIDKLRYERYEQIYHSFCRPGTLNPIWEVCSLERIDFKLAKVLTPLINRLAQSSKPCDLKAFCQALEKFAQKLSPIEKSTLYSTGKAHPTDNMPSFIPQITDYKSQNLLIRSKLSLYERLLQDKHKSKSKVNEKKMKRIEDELYECTFHPKTLEYRKLVKTTAFVKGDQDEFFCQSPIGSF